jgi:transposase-like protein
MKEGVYQEIKEGIVLHIKAFIEGLLNYQAYEISNAGWYKHSKERNDWRNGYRKRYLLTNYWQIRLNFPRLREHSVGKRIIERYRKRSKFIDSTISEMYFKSVSVRNIKKAISKMFGNITI